MNAGSTLTRLLLPLVVAAAAALAPDAEEVDWDRAHPLLRRYCHDCHNPDKRKGDLDLASLTSAAAAEADPALWERVHEALDFEDMPPRKADQPSDEERAALIAYARRASTVEVTWDDHVAPLIRKYCHECHNDDRAKGSFRNKVNFDDLAVADNRDRWLGWHTVIRELQRDEMPPKKGKHRKPAHRPTEAERQTIIAWAKKQRHEINTELDCEHFGVGDRRWANHMARTVWTRRLTADEYRIAVDDLLGAAVVDPGLLPEDGAGSGFNRTGKNLFMSSAHLEKLLSAADAAIRTLYEGGSTPVAEARDALLAPLDEDGVAPPAAIRRIVRPLMRRAFRNEIDDATLERFAGVADVALDAGRSPRDALRLCLAGILVSPSFVYLRDDGTGEGMRPMDQHTLAGRLAIFLWSSVPDHALLDAARRGELDPDGLAKHARRMLADPRTVALANDFGTSWLHVGSLGRDHVPDTTVFPEYDEELERAMLAEVDHTFLDWFRNDRPVRDLIDGDHVWVDERLARHYGIEEVRGREFRRVRVDDDRRGGVIGMAAPLTVTSSPDRNNVVLRGIYVLETLLGKKVPPPPEDVGNLPPPSVDGKVLTVRERLALHRSNAECNACHQKFDPLGFALEGYDAIGRWRTTEAGKPIDDRGTMNDGRTIDGVDGLRQVLLEREGEFNRHLAKKLITYAIGRRFRLYDRCSLDAVVERCEEDGWTSHVMVDAVVRSDSFRLRLYGADFIPGVTYIQKDGKPAPGDPARQKKKKKK